MEIIKKVFGEMLNNCYIIFDAESRDAYVIDPGYEAEEIAGIIAEKKLGLKGIILTHFHYDHSDACDELRALTNAPVFIHEADEAMYTGHADITINDGHIFNLGREIINAVHAPGHSDGGICLVAPESKVVFTGDTIFPTSTGFIIFDSCSAEVMGATIRKLDKILPDDYTIWPGHRESVNMEYVRKHNKEYNNYLQGKILTNRIKQKSVYLYTLVSNAINELRFRKKQQPAEDIAYLDSVLTYIRNAETFEDLEDIGTELTENGILTKPTAKEKSKKINIKPYEYTTASGRRILVGRNNKENDILTFKTASEKDIWLHTKDIPGSHVILFTDGIAPTEEEISEAASLAAFHSKARRSRQTPVPVDYVPVKYIIKPRSAKPGSVRFTHNKTVYAAPKKPEKNTKF